MGSADPDKLSKAGALFLSLIFFLSPLAYRGTLEKFLNYAYSSCQALLPVLNEASQPLNFLVSSYFSCSVLSQAFRLSEKLEAQTRTSAPESSVPKFTSTAQTHGASKKLLSAFWRLIYMRHVIDT